MDEEILTVKEVASLLKVKTRTNYRMLKQQQIPAFKVRNQWRFKRSAIMEWINKQSMLKEIQPEVAIPQKKGESPGRPT